MSAGGKLRSLLPNSLFPSRDNNRDRYDSASGKFGRHPGGTNVEANIEKLKKEKEQAGVLERVQAMSGDNLDVFRRDFIDVLTNEKHNSAVNVVHSALWENLTELKRKLENRTEVREKQLEKLQSVDQKAERLEEKSGSGDERKALRRIEREDQRNEDLLRESMALDDASIVLAEHVVALAALKKDIDDKTDIEENLERVWKGARSAEKAAVSAIECYNEIQTRLSRGENIDRTVEESAICFWNMMYLWAALREDTEAELTQLENWNNKYGAEQRQRIKSLLDAAGPEQRLSTSSDVSPLESAL